jgi:hypothetical protein
MPARCGMFYRWNEGAEWVYDAKIKRWSESDLRGKVLYISKCHYD